MTGLGVISFSMEKGGGTAAGAVMKHGVPQNAGILTSCGSLVRTAFHVANTYKKK